MKLKEILRFNWFKVLITLILEALVYLVGISVFRNPVLLKTGCAPNLTCPACESCLKWSFPEIINFKAVLVTLLLSYFLSGLIYKTLLKKHR